LPVWLWEMFSCLTSLGRTGPRFDWQTELSFKSGWELTMTGRPSAC